MQGSKASSFVKMTKRSKAFDDEYSGRQKSKKNDFHKQERAKANRQNKENKE